MDGHNVTKSVIAFGGATATIAAMFVVLVAYLVFTYASTGIVVALLSTAVVVVTAGIPYVVMRRRCARDSWSRETPREAAAK